VSMDKLSFPKQRAEDQDPPFTGFIKDKLVWHAIPFAIVAACFALGRRNGGKGDWINDGEPPLTFKALEWAGKKVFGKISGEAVVEKTNEVERLSFITDHFKEEHKEQAARDTWNIVRGMLYAGVYAAWRLATSKPVPNQMSADEKYMRLRALGKPSASQL
jgi:hypothetical protein